MSTDKNGALPVAKSKLAETPSGTVTPIVTSAPENPFTGSIKIGVGTTHSTP